MPRKKKKSRDSGGTPTSSTRGSSDVISNSNSSPRASAAATFESQGKNNDTQDLMDMVSLEIVKSSTPPTKTLKYLPTILLTSDDAIELGVVTGDDVFIFKVSSSPSSSSSNDKEQLKIYKSAMVRVHVYSTTGITGSTPSNPTRTPPSSKSSMSSPGGSSMKQQNQRSKLRPGNCHIFPIALATSFLSREEEEEIQQQGTNSTNQLIPTTPIQQQQPNRVALTTPTPSSSSSSSKSKFSFASGGGGDVLISTPTKVKPSPTTPSTKTTTNMKLVVIPVSTDLGEYISTTLCQTSRFIRVQPEDDKKVQCFHLYEHLMLAHITGSYVSKSTKFCMSFQGQSLMCEISHIGGRQEEERSSSAPVKELTSDFSNLSLTPQQNLYGDDDECKSFLTALLEQQKCERLQLYKITNNTKVIIGEQKDHLEEGDKKKEEHPTMYVAGLESTVAEVESWLDTTFHNNFQLGGHHMGIRPPRGLLLHGPSGTGKSTLAMQILKRFESRVHVEHIHCTALQSETAIVGQAERQLVRIFQSAKRRRPGKAGTIIALDDVHLICPRRQGVNLGTDRLSSTLLALLDGVEDESGQSSLDAPGGGMINRFYPVVIIAITTNPSLLDPALRRPGRLDSEVEVLVPGDAITRKKILQFQLESLSAEANLTPNEWLGLARQAKGFTGADMKLAIKECIRACSNSHDNSDMTHPGGGDRRFLVSKQELERAIRATKPSCLQAVTVEIPQVQWSSIGGMENAKRQLREAIELPLTHGQMFTKLGIQPPRGVLLYGPPGCSKTLMARALATEGHMNFLAVKGPELLSKWLGESERTLASLFKRARLASPSVIFFDEVDAIASKRSGNSSGGERLLSQMLTELDGIQKNADNQQRRRVVVVCATNRPDLLDNALMRPGRIDRMIYVGVPDINSRNRILEISLKGKACADDVDISHLADDSVSGGLSGAEVVAACRNAALMALEEDNQQEELDSTKPGPVIQMCHLEKSLITAERQITQGMLDFYASFQGRDQ